MNELEIRPFRGFDGVLLGMTREQVESVLGRPAELTRPSYESGDIDESWVYPELGVTLSFSEDDGYRLGTITFEAPKAVLRGIRPLRESEARLNELFGAWEDLDLELEDDFPELDSRDYWCEQLGLSFWIESGRVVSVSLFPEYIDDEPRWPVPEPAAEE